MFPPTQVMASTSTSATAFAEPSASTSAASGPVPTVPHREGRSTNSGKVLDDISRERRHRRQLDALEMDNFQEEPHADLVMSKKLPKFAETIADTSPMTTPKEKGKLRATRNKKYRPAEYYKMYRKTFAQLLEEDSVVRGEQYAKAVAPPSKYPPRKFCNVCGLPSPYTCGQCGIRYCTIKCFKTHQETRCLKYTA